jgi:hypothetical protein
LASSLYHSYTMLTLCANTMLTPNACTICMLTPR